MEVVFLFLQNDTAAVFWKVKWKALAAGNIWSLGWLLAVNATPETSQGAASFMSDGVTTPWEVIVSLQPFKK